MMNDITIQDVEQLLSGLGPEMEFGDRDFWHGGEEIDIHVHKDEDNHMIQYVDVYGLKEVEETSCFTADCSKLLLSYVRILKEVELPKKMQDETERTPEEILSLLSTLTQMVREGALPPKIQDVLGDSATVRLAEVDKAWCFVFQHEIETAMGVFEMEEVYNVGDHVFDALRGGNNEKVLQ
jgi:hypothetical protein